MVKSLELMNRKLLTIQSCDGNKVKFLEMQVRARVEGTTKFEYKGFDARLMNNKNNIRMKPKGNCNVASTLQYLIDLLTLMTFSKTAIHLPLWAFRNCLFAEPFHNQVRN